jgi:glucose-6-phosphate 1-dehydrogenase
LKCGKALNERKAEIRIQFHENPSNLYPGSPRNELVIRVQPDEAIYFKFNSKVPGLDTKLVQTELDLTYKQRFDERLPDAYERLIYDVFRGDHNLFVRVDELEASWKLFTPLLHKLESDKVSSTNLLGIVNHIPRSNLSFIHLDHEVQQNLTR